MGNPAMDRRKKSEKRRKRFELRLGPGAYLPREQREQLNAELDKLAKEEIQARAERKKAGEARRAAAKQAATQAPPKNAD